MGVGGGQRIISSVTRITYLTAAESILAGPVAQSAERWTPRGESTRPGYNSPGSKRDGRLTFMSLLTGMVAVGGPW